MGAIIVIVLLANVVVPLFGQGNLGFGLIEEVQGLCENIHEPFQLIEATSVFLGSVSSSRRVTLVSYSTPGIYEYAGYSLAINAIYARKHGYSIVNVPPDEGNYEPHDSRWNKVKIMEKLVAESQEQGKGGEYFVWLDSDLILLDLNFDLEKDIISAHPDANIIMSRDPRPENGIANTGAIVIKSSEFSLAFLKKWFHAFDRKAGMDQHIFDRVYSRVKVWNGGRETAHYGDDSGEGTILDSLSDGEFSSRFVFLAPNAINTNFPAWHNQVQGDKVLHLAGLSITVRREVFRAGLGNICNATREAAAKAREYADDPENGQRGSNHESYSVPEQLGLHRDRLASIVFDLSLQREHMGYIQTELRRSRGDVAVTLKGLRSKYGTRTARNKEEGRGTWDASMQERADKAAEVDLIELQRLVGPLSATMQQLKDNRQTGYDAAQSGALRGMSSSGSGMPKSMEAAVTEKLSRDASLELLELLSFVVRGAEQVSLSCDNDGYMPIETALVTRERPNTKLLAQEVIVGTLQLVIEAAFDALQMLLNPPSDPQVMGGHDRDIRRCVMAAREAIEKLLGYADRDHNRDSTQDGVNEEKSGGNGESSSLGPVLYYKFKLHHFEAAMYTSRHVSWEDEAPNRETSQHRRGRRARRTPEEEAKATMVRFEGELLSLTKAHRVLRRLHALKWYGGGNGLADPGRELVEIRARMGSLYCALHSEDEDAAAGDTRKGESPMTHDGLPADGKSEEGLEAWSHCDEGVMAIVDALRLLLWRWRPVLAQRGLVGGLEIVIEKASTGVLKAAMAANDNDNDEVNDKADGYPWSVKEISISPGNEEGRGEPAGEGVEVQPLPSIAPQLTIPVYVLENMWGCLLALGHCLLLETAPRSQEKSKSFEEAARAVIQSAIKVRDVLSRGYDVTIDSRPLEAVEAKLREKQRQRAAQGEELGVAFRKARKRA